MPGDRFTDPFPQSTAGDSLPRRFQEVENFLGKIYVGEGDPLNVVNATVGSLFLRTDGGAAATLYVKESATDSTGWVAK